MNLLTMIATICVTATEGQAPRKADQCLAAMQACVLYALDMAYDDLRVDRKLTDAETEKAGKCVADIIGKKGK